jgi:hypothetical protein
VDQIQLHSGGIFMCFFHVFRHNNYEADELANRAIGKAPGLLGVNLEESYAPLS